MTKNICFIIGNRAHFSRVKTIMKHLDSRSYSVLLFEAAALTHEYNLKDEIQQLFGKEIHVRTFQTNVAGSNLVTMTKSTGLSIMELASFFQDHQPDIAVVVADRYEALAATIAARYMNIPVAHIQGGENTGSIDDSVRHAITKLANLHFTSNKDSTERIIKMGEDPQTIYTTGCPTLDIIPSLTPRSPQELFSLPYAVEQYLVVNFHPVTTEYSHNQDNFAALLEAVKETQLPTFWLMPNIDAGSDIVNQQIKDYQTEADQRIHFFKHLPTEDYLGLIKNAACLVGNSSVGIRESALLGTPSVNIGNRQKGRLRGRNVVDSTAESQEIREKIVQQITHGPYEPDTLYGNGSAGAQIAKILINTKATFDKRMMY